MIIFYILISHLVGFFLGIFIKRDIYDVNSFFATTSFDASLMVFVYLFVVGVDDGVILKYSITVGPLQISLSFLLNILVSIKLVVVTYNIIGTSG